MPGRPHFDPEIEHLCLTIRASRGWSYDRIAEHIFHKKGAACPKDPTRPVNRSTVMRMIHRAKKRMVEEKPYRIDVEETIAAIELDSLKELIYDLIEAGEVSGIENTLKFVQVARLLLKDRRDFFGLDAPVRSKVEVQTNAGGVPPKKLNRDSERAMADFERWLAEAKNGSDRS